MPANPHDDIRNKFSSLKIKVFKTSRLAVVEARPMLQEQSEAWRLGLQHWCPKHDPPMVLSAAVHQLGGVPVA